MARKFCYYADPREVANYLKGLGYEVTEFHDRQGKEALGFVVARTTIDLSYHHVIDGKVVGHGMIRLQTGTLDPDPDNPYNNLVNEDPERYQQSLKLYHKLYRRFSRPRSGDKVQQWRWLSFFAKERRFRYHVEPEEIRKYLVEMGYKPQDYYGQDGENIEGFIVLSGKIRISYGGLTRISNGGAVEAPMIGLYIPPNRNSPDSESLELYERLHERFYYKASTPADP